MANFTAKDVNELRKSTGDPCLSTQRVRVWVAGLTIGGYRCWYDGLQEGFDRS